MEKEYIVTLILGLLVLAIAFGFITSNIGNDANTELCRQSVIVRGSIPEVKVANLNIVNLKEKYPLNCETGVLKIDYEDKEKATKEIMDAMAECWYMFGNGQYDFLSNYKFRPKFNSESLCSVCTRVHFDESVKDFYISNPINIKEGLDLELKNGISYKNYLVMNVSGVIQNYYIAEDSISGDVLEGKFVSGDKSSKTLPEFVNVSKGDFFITYRYFKKGENYKYSDILFFPYDNGKSFETLAEDRDGLREFLSFGFNSDVPACHHWEGIPA